MLNQPCKPDITNPEHRAEFLYAAGWFFSTLLTCKLLCLYYNFFCDAFIILGIKNFGEMFSIFESDFVGFI